MRLINADALSAAMYHKSFDMDDGRQRWDSGLWIRYKVFEEALDEAPTIDAVLVVRCEDCKHFAPDKDGGTWGMCMETRSIMPKGSGCLDGERKEEL